MESKKQNKGTNITKQKQSHRCKQVFARGKGDAGKREIGEGGCVTVCFLVLFLILVEMVSGFHHGE